MVPSRHPQPVAVPPKAPPHDTPPAVEDRAWYASSWELAHGLDVMEIVETAPGDQTDP